MTDEAKALVEKLRALHVWPQVVADDHADLLTPRRIDKLYEIGRVSHEAADLIETQAREIERLTLTVRKLQGNQAALEAELAKFKALAETLAGALGEIEEGTYPRPLGKPWRMDASSSKHDRCIHDAWMYEACEACIDAFATEALRQYKEARDD